MARPKATIESKFVAAAQELGIDKAQMILDILKWKAPNLRNKKSPETDPNLKAEERTNEPSDNTPTGS